MNAAVLDVFFGLVTLSLSLLVAVTDYGSRHPQ